MSGTLSPTWFRRIKRKKRYIRVRRYIKGNIDKKCYIEYILLFGSNFTLVGVCKYISSVQQYCAKGEKKIIQWQPMIYRKEEKNELKENSIQYFSSVGESKKV